MNVVAAFWLRSIQSHPDTKEEEYARMIRVLEQGEPLIPTVESWGTSREAQAAVQEALRWSQQMEAEEPGGI